MKDKKSKERLLAALIFYFNRKDEISLRACATKFGVDRKTLGKHVKIAEESGVTQKTDLITYVEDLKDGRPSYLTTEGKVQRYDFCLT
jgi:DNA-binding MarR family transcriptional regulator